MLRKKCFSFSFCAVIPSRPEKVQAIEVTNSSLHLTWQPSFGGIYPIMLCSVQVRQAHLKTTVSKRSNTGLDSIHSCTEQDLAKKSPVCLFILEFSNHHINLPNCLKEKHRPLFVSLRTSIDWSQAITTAGHRFVCVCLCVYVCVWMCVCLRVCVCACACE